MGISDFLRDYLSGRLTLMHARTREARIDRSDLLAETDRIRAMTVGPLQDSVYLLRQDRDSR